MIVSMIFSMIFLMIYVISYFKVRVSTGFVETHRLGWQLLNGLNAGRLFSRTLRVIFRDFFEIGYSVFSFFPSFF